MPASPLSRCVVLFGVCLLLFACKTSTFSVRFCTLKNVRSFVFNDFLASFPLFLCFLRRSILPAARPIQFFVSASEHRRSPLRQIVHHSTDYSRLS